MADYNLGSGDLLRDALAQQAANGGRVGVTMLPVSQGVAADKLITSPANVPALFGSQQQAQKTTQGPMPQTENGQATPEIRPGSPADYLQRNGSQLGTNLVNSLFGGGSPSGYGATPYVFGPGY